MATFTNQATLRYNGNVVNSNVTTGELIEVLSAAKTAVIDTYNQGSDITYVINIVNSGSVAFSGISVTDNLGAYTFGLETLVPLDYVDGSIRYYVNGALQPAPVVAAGPPLVINGLTVPANGVTTVIYVARANQYAPLDLEGIITNTAVIAGGGVAEITVTETVTPDSGVRLTIAKSICPRTVTENGTLTYTFVIENTGNTPALVADNVSIGDVFNPILTDLTVTFNDVVWSEGVEYVYSEATGEFATVVGQITIPAATFVQDAVSGEWLIEPGIGVLTVTGTV
ncbi:MAG: hypothetical protein IKU83_00430 [Lachnospiraceae bacterium]|nr:hypothetical protein [Lachnospiraceae bacterium]